MGQPRSAKPTELELVILKVLWRAGPSTARQVMEELSGGREVGYTTVLKMLQIMEQKELVGVDRAARTHVYEAKVERTSTLKSLTRDLLDRAFDGAVSEMLVHLVDDSRLDADELGELERRIAELREREGRSDG